MGELSGPTMASIGAAAGVSRQTVWNVLHAPHRVKPETRERVEAAIRAHQYRPNRVARSLRTRSARLLGYCVAPRVGPDLNPVQDRFLHAVTEAAEARGYHVLLFTASGPTGPVGPLAAYEELLAEAAVDGFVLSDTGLDDPRQAWLGERGVPFAAFGRTWSTGQGRDEYGSWVDIDGAAGTEAAVGHLRERGYRRIGFVGWPEGSAVGDDRLSGWARACGSPGPVARGENSSDDGRRAAAELLAEAHVDALVCVSDLMALGALAEVRERGLRPGTDVAVVGFDDAPFAALPGVELTSLAQPIERVGAEVVRLLIDELTGVSDGGNEQSPQHQHILLAPSLRVRSSTDNTPRSAPSTRD